MPLPDIVAAARDYAQLPRCRHHTLRHAGIRLTPPVRMSPEIFRYGEEVLLFRAERSAFFLLSPTYEKLSARLRISAIRTLIRAIIFRGVDLP